MLDKDFINVWLLAKDLDAIAAAGDEDLAKLCSLIQANYGYPVDSVLISAEGKVIGHLNVTDEPARDPAAYRTFLLRGLSIAGRASSAVAPRGAAPGIVAQSSVEGTAGVKPGAVSEGHPSGPQEGSEPTQPAPFQGLVLGPQQPEGSLLNVVRNRGFGKSSMLFLPIDASAFVGPGTIEVQISMGGAEASADFELCAPVEGPRPMVGPVETLRKLGPGKSGTMAYRFEKGAQFMLAVRPATGVEPGEVNAFRAQVVVRLD